MPRHHKRSARLGPSLQGERARPVRPDAPSWALNPQLVGARGSVDEHRLLVALWRFDRRLSVPPTVVQPVRHRKKRHERESA